ncbi:MAG TPA: phosphatidate cytidylyltransferase [Xanthobacteraceae bacterium]|nr:phosphatidate cytidylyltransferase [Xanthobacteraceae bacterium]
MASQQVPSGAGGSNARNLALRLAAAAVLIPVTLVLAWWGGWWWLVLVALAAIGLFVEWLMMVGSQREPGVVAGGAALVIAAVSVLCGRPEAAIGLCAAGAAVVAILCSVRRAWSTLGFLYAAAALLASMLVRGSDVAGFQALIFVFLIVWVTDTLGYFVGRSVGGPKLWPRVSPNKTWAGALGGFGGSLVVAIVSTVLGYLPLLPALLLGAGLSVMSQLGDLFESAVKRRFGVKDSSQLIPGHGGLLDRLDGYVAAIVAAALIGFLRGDLDGIGRGLMVW